MKTERKILICGASIAGPCLAFWLDRAGFNVTVIERAEKLRDGGQNIDIKGSGKTIVEMMGLLAAIKENTTDELGLRFVDSAGSVIAEFPKDGELSLTQDIEIRRGDLSRVFYDATKARVAYRFGMTVQSITQLSNSIRAELSDGSTEEYDLVVSAEGIGSATRKLVMDEFVRFKYLGVRMAYFRIPKLSRDDQWARWYNAAGGRVLLTRPSSTESESVCLDFKSDDGSVVHQPLDEQRATIRTILNGMGWESDRISESLDYDDDLYTGPVSQVKASRWSKGRFALVGDAAHAPSPVTGMGTTLAITGAYVLAGELAKNEDVLAALKSYEKILRPFVERSQHLPSGVPGIAHPKTRWGIQVLNTAARAAASRPVQKIFAFVNSKKKRGSNSSQSDEFAIPHYELETV